MTRIARVTLAKSVLTSIIIFHLTVLPMPKWAQRLFDRTSRRFIWHGDDQEAASGGHSLVNWKTVCRPKSLGGLGIADLERFGRALRLRWPWLQWTEPDRPWVGSPLPCDASDMNLFRASTKITLGNGQTALFWHDSWSSGGPLSIRAPNLFKIATRKNRTVSAELHNDTWIQSIARLTNLTQFAEFLDIATIIQDTNLLEDQADTIRWLWTEDGCYSAASAYAIQFQGSFSKFEPSKVWRAFAEPKAKFFAWLVLHKRIFTADLLATKGWPHDPTCQLCLTHPETVAHLCMECPFTVAVWNTIDTWSEDKLGPFIGTLNSVDSAWCKIISNTTSANARVRSARITYIMWNVWKERNRRIFDGRRQTYLEVAFLAYEELRQVLGVLHPSGPPRVVQLGE